eukprot:NODE_2898_length_2124_cov_28.132699.p1 GENE.NODE_2898_length_2124_cov_28.132699~~NODE_2898_length_2124_cov_28.132699.p1  ORF type:complete len:646 (-),score=97.85 NODE_2898_length_2124_cov_28.132699:185-1927(-)
MTAIIKNMLDVGFAQHEARMKELSCTDLRTDTCASPSPEASFPMEELGRGVDEMKQFGSGVEEMSVQGSTNLLARQDDTSASIHRQMREVTRRVQMEEVATAMQVAPLNDDQVRKVSSSIGVQREEVVTAMQVAPLNPPFDDQLRKVTSSSRAQMEEVVTAMQVAPLNPPLDDQARHPFIAKVALVTQDMRFEYTSGLFVALNAILIAVDADLTIKGTARPLWCEQLAVTFVILFVVEVGLRALAMGPRLRYGKNTDRQWLLFDVFVLATIGLDELLTRLAHVSISMAVLRLLRAFRFLRMLRILRTVGLFAELRVMITGIQGSFVSLVGCLSLLSLLMVSVGVIIVQMLAEALKSGLDPEQCMFVNDHFGSMLITVYTLFMAITGGIDWGDIFMPLRSIDSIATLVFIFYVAMGLFCMLNVVTGLYVEKAMTIMRSDRTAVELSETAKRTRNIRMLQDIFRQGTSDLDPMIKCVDFVHHCSDPTVQSCLRMVGCEVDETSAQEVFNFLDDNQKGALTLSELIVGVTNISGPAQQLTVARMEYRLQSALGQCLRSADTLSNSHPSAHSGTSHDIKEQVIL